MSEHLPDVDQLPEHWSVTVEANAETLLTISSQHVAGRELTGSDEKIIEGAARHLLAFIGAPEMPLDDRAEYARVRSLGDEDIVKECMGSWQQVVRELANRYDVVVEKLETANKRIESYETLRNPAKGRLVRATSTTEATHEFAPPADPAPGDDPMPNEATITSALRLKERPTAPINGLCRLAEIARSEYSWMADHEQADYREQWATLSAAIDWIDSKALAPQGVEP